ncbi:MAG: hypothetical protein ACRCWQ_13205, partial [Bacilli bacterium]
WYRVATVVIPSMGTGVYPCEITLKISVGSTSEAARQLYITTLRTGKNASGKFHIVETPGGDQYFSKIRAVTNGGAIYIDVQSNTSNALYYRMHLEGFAGSDWNRAASVFEEFTLISSVTSVTLLAESDLVPAMVTTGKDVVFNGKVNIGNKVPVLATKTSSGYYNVQDVLELNGLSVNHAVNRGFHEYENVATPAIGPVSGQPFSTVCDFQLTNSSTEIGNLNLNQFLVVIEASIADEPFYRGHLIGILTLTHIYNNKYVVRADFKLISARGLNGNANSVQDETSLWSNCAVFFTDNNGSATVDSTKKNCFLRFHMFNMRPNRNATYKAKMIRLHELTGQSGSFGV